MPELVVVINSCARYHRATVPVLIDSLREASVPLDVVHVVVGETPPEECRDDTFAGAHAHFVPYANVDNNALLWATLDAPFPDDVWVFYLHDTCTVEPRFWDRARSILRDVEADHVAAKIHGPFSMCIGLYSLAALRSDRVVRQLRAGVSTDASPGAVLRVKHQVEDLFFRILAPVFTIPNPYCIEKEDVRMYDTDTPRIVEYYADPGVRKYKANHGQAPRHLKL